METSSKDKDRHEKQIMTDEILKKCFTEVERKFKMLI